MRRRSFLGGSLIPVGGLLLGAPAQAQAPSSEFIFPNYASMQAFSSTLADQQRVSLVGYFPQAAYNGYQWFGAIAGGGDFVCDVTDTTLPDDGGTICVTAAGQRLKRVIEHNFVTPEMFGATGNPGGGIDNSADDGHAVRRAMAYLNGPTAVVNRLSAKRAYKFTDLDPDHAGRCCLSMDRDGLTIDGGGFFYTHPPDTFTETFESLLEIKGEKSTIRDISLRLWGIGKGTVTKGVISISIGNISAGHHIENVTASCETFAPHVVYGQCWNSTFLHCTWSGGTDSPFCIVSSTGLLVAQCYAVGSATSPYGFQLGGWYGAAIGLSCDNITSGYAYQFVDREWTATDLGSENCAGLIEGNCTTLTVNGMNFIGSNGTKTPIWIKGNGVARIHGGISSVGAGQNGRIVDVNHSSYLETDFPYSSIIMVDDNQMPLGTDGFAERVRSSAIYTVSQNATLPYPVPQLIGGDVRGQGFRPILFAGWRQGSPALGSLIQIATYPLLLFRCTTSGSTGSSSPAWNATAGATTTDGAAVWTAEKINHDSMGPITCWFGTGRQAISGLGSINRQAVALTKPLAFKDVAIEWAFQAVDFYFDLNDPTLDAFSLMNVKHLDFNDCTFNFLSPARCVFGAASARAGGNALVTVRQNCKLNPGLVGAVIKGVAHYWRSWVPSSYSGDQVDAFVRFSPLPWSSSPVDTLWDGDIDPELLQPDGNGFVRYRVTTPGWIGASPPPGVPMAVLRGLY